MDDLKSADLPPEGPVTPRIDIETEMRRSYLDYAMSVIVSRAIPDARDGLKPVHRRILYAMREGGYNSDKSYKKSARIVGDVMGKYHPHGDSAIYDALVRMAQDFSMGLKLVDGQGNFGAIDGSSPAQMRYTEARLSKPGEAMLEDIDKNTVDFRPNYDESEQEPEVLPARIPNLLVNGGGGIAVGMATNIPPHNLGEVIDGTCALMDNPDLTIDELRQYILGPDFPTGGQILGRSGIRSAYHTGNGSVPLRATAEITDEGEGGRPAIVFTDVPYQINMENTFNRLRQLRQSKALEGIHQVRDLSSKEGVRVVIEVQKGHEPEVVLNQLYRYTPFQGSFACNMLALDHGRPRSMSLKDILAAFLRFREDVITRRTVYELNKARDRAHVLCGLAVAVANIDEVVALIRHADSPASARQALMERAWPSGDVAPLIRLVDDPEFPLNEDGTYNLSEVQARAILDLRLHRLTALERNKIGDELKTITDHIRECLEILSSREKLLDVLRQELHEIKAKFAEPRKTEILDIEEHADMESLIQREEMVVTVTHGGYIKRTPLDSYRAQKRGGKGRAGLSMKDEDFVTDLFVASTHAPILIFTSRGIVHRLKVYQLPVGNPQARGKALINLLPLQQDERISVIMRAPEDEEKWEELDIMFATAAGNVRRNKLTDFKNIRSNGLIAMKLDEGDSLVSVRPAREDEDVLLTTKNGKAIRFQVTDVRVFAGRTSTGVRGIRLAKGDEVIGMSILRSPEDVLLCVSEQGYGKRTPASEYRVTGRGGQGVVNMNITGKTGPVIATFPVTEEHQVMLVTDGGQLIRTPVTDVRIAGRATQGVRLFNVAKGERVVSVTWIIEDSGDEEEDAADTEESGETSAES